MVKGELVTELSGEEINNFIKKGVVMVDFYADWCMPCITMGPVVEEIAEKLKGKIKIGKVNVGDYPEIAQKFNVSSIPNFIVFKDGKQVDSFTGTMYSEEIEEKLKQVI
ncbi:MAG: thioredoxin [Minisyncoccales bacterium]